MSEPTEAADVIVPPLVIEGLSLLSDFPVDVTGAEPLDCALWFAVVSGKDTLDAPSVLPAIPDPVSSVLRSVPGVNEKV